MPGNGTAKTNTELLDTTKTTVVTKSKTVPKISTAKNRTELLDTIKKKAAPITVPRPKEQPLKAFKPQEEIQEFEAGLPTSQLPKEPKTPKMDKPELSLNKAKLDKLKTSCWAGGPARRQDQDDQPAAAAGVPCMTSTTCPSQSAEAKYMRDGGQEGQLQDHD